MSLPGVRIESVGVLRRRISLARKLAWSSLAGVVIPLVAAILLDRFAGTKAGYQGLAIGLLLAPILGLVSLLVRHFRFGGAGAIGVNGSDLVIERRGRETRIPLSRVEAGWSSPARGEATLVLRGGDEIRAAVPRPEDAERLLVAAGLDASKRTMRMKLGETTFLDILVVLLGPALVTPLTQAIARAASLPWEASVFVFLGLFTLLFGLVRTLFGPARVIVGADGVILAHGLRDRFVPYERLASVKAAHDHVDFVLTDGSRARARARHLDAKQQAELRARLDVATAAFRRGGIDAEALSRLDRGGRAIGDWRAAMRGLLEHQGSYRETPLTREQLFAVLESPAASSERRLAAAVSLSAAGEAQIATRIRVAAEACARPQVRIALAGVADGAIDDAAIEEAIAADEASPTRA